MYKEIENLLYYFFLNSFYYYTEVSTMKKIFYVSLLLIVLMVGSVWAACPASMVSYWNFDTSYDDDFSGSSIDSTMWSQTKCSGCSIELSSNMIQMFVDATGSTVYSGLNSITDLSGDFEIQIDFNLDTFPTPSAGENQIQLIVSSTESQNYFTAYYGRSSTSNFYLSHYKEGGVFSAGTKKYETSSSGKFKIRRVGSTFSSYFWNNSQWTLLREETSAWTSDVFDINLRGWSASGANDDLTINFDNFIINSGEPSDDSVGSNDGVIDGAISTTGRLGSALDFDGVDDYVDVGNFDPTGSSGKYLSAFAYTKSTSGVVNRNIFAKWDFGLAKRSWQAFIDSNDKLTVILSPDGLGNYKSYSTTATVADNLWHHVGFTWDDGTLKVYLDGQEAAVTKNNDNSFNAVFLPSIDVIIGGNLWSGEYRYSFDGQIDEVAIYNTALTAQQIADLYAGSSNNLGYCSGAVQVTEPVWSGSLDLTTAGGIAIDDTTNETTLQVRDGVNPLVEFTRSGSLNMSAFTIDSDASRTVVDFTDVTGTTGTHSLFIPDNGGGVFICPDATSLGDVAVGCSNSVTIASCPGTSGVYSCTDEGSYFKVTGLTGTGVGTTCDDCADCDTGLYCDLRDGTPTCKNDTLVAAVACVDCVDNDADTLIDLDDPGCAGSSSGTSEVDGGGATIPEFNFVGYLLILVIAGIGLYFISKK